MNINLASFNCKSLHITTKCEIEQNLLEKIKKCSSLPDEAVIKKVIAFGNVYSINKKKYSAIGFVEKPRKNKCYIGILYETGSLIKKTSNLKPILDLLSYLTELKNNYEFKCQASFEYSPSKYNSKIPLPLKIEGFFLDEIRGFRGTKSKNKELVFDIIIERPENKKIYHTIYFDYNGKFSPKLPENILKIAIETSKNYITKK